jgi:hypothetical protein
MLYHVSSKLSIQLFDILSVSNVVNSQNIPSVYFYVYVYGATPYGSCTTGEQTWNIRGTKQEHLHIKKEYQINNKNIHRYIKRTY